LNKNELVKLWGNDDKRKEFLKDYKAWGVWITVPELGLTYYKYELPDGGRILAMEYIRENSSRYRSPDEGEYQVCTHYYLWDGEYFIPRFSCESEIIERLKRLKVSMQAEIRTGADA